MSLSIPFTFTGGAGHKAKASEVNANFQSVANKFTEGAGGIVDADISSSAGIKGTKISNTPGNRIPNDRLEADAVDSAALKSDATAGSPNAGVGSSDHIKDGIITNAKLVNATILAGKIKVSSVTTVALSDAAFFGAGAITANTFSKAYSALGITAGSTIVSCYLEKFAGGGVGDGTAYTIFQYLVANVLIIVVGYFGPTTTLQSQLRVKVTYVNAT